MIAVLRLAVFGFIGLSIAYILVVIYSGSVHREALEKEWDGDPARPSGPPEARAAFIKQGMKAYHHSLRRKLIVLVYIIPMAIVIITAYLVNHP